MKAEIINKIFPNPLPTIEEIEAKYPPRQLPEGAKVTRVGPSPTGLMHIGNLIAALIPERLAHQSNGVFFLRIEDTDQKRKVDGAVDLILNSLYGYGIQNDEGPVLNGPEKGNYGPYFQSARKEIYQAYVKDWLEKDLAYPCFCTEEENEKNHALQVAQNARPGYHGGWARCRNLSEETVLQNLNEGKKFVIRFKSPGHYNKKIVIQDVLRGKREFPENDLDIVILKGDGLPTYHFAHLIDDHLMGTTHVIRGEEWLSSLPLHIQLFQAMGWKPPKYGHIAHVQKMDENGNRRKFSKRLDPEAKLTYYSEKGYPKTALIEYLLNLANSNFEDWRRANPDKPYTDFELSLNKLNSSGALFDLVKLNSISKDVIGKMTAREIYDYALEWMKNYDVPFSEVMEKNKDYMIRIFNIEREGVKKVRKDIAVWSDVKNEVSYFFDDQFTLTTGEAYKLLSPLSVNHIMKIVNAFVENYDEADSKEVWFEKIKKIAEVNGFATDMKAYKAEPSNFKGSVADVAKVLRIFVTGKEQSPDLYAIMQVMGKDRVLKRLTIA